MLKSAYIHKLALQPIIVACILVSFAVAKIEAQSHKSNLPPHLAGTFRTSNKSLDDQQSSLFFGKPDLTPSSTALWSGFADFALDYPYAFCGMPHGLMILDVSSDTLPQIVSMTLSESIFEVELRGDYLFTLMHSGYFIRSLVIFDIANVNEPRIVGRLDGLGSPADLKIIDNKCYLGGSSNLSVIDIADPGNPTMLGSLDLDLQISNQIINAIQIKDSLAFAVTGIGLEIINVSNPDSMYRVGSLETPGWVKNVALAGDFLLLGDGPSILPPCALSRLHVVSYDSPSLPVIEGTLSIPSGGIWKMVVSDSIAFVTNGSSGDLVIATIGDPSNMAIEGIFDGQGVASAVHVSGDRVFLSAASPSSTDIFCNIEFPEGEEPGGFHIIDISDFRNPTEIGELHSPGFSETVAASGNLMFVAGRVLTKDFGGLKVMDISDPNSPVLKAIYNTQGSIMAISSSGNRVYVAQIDINQGVVRLQCLEISPSCQISFLGDATAHGFPYGISIVEETVYLAHSDGLDVFGPQGTNTIALLHTLPLPLGAGAVFAESNSKVFITTATNEFKILDFSTPTSPTTIGSTDIGVYSCSILRRDSICIVVHENGFKLINVSEPTSPSVISSLEGLTGLLDGALQGDFLFLSVVEKGVLLADLSDPLFPRLVDSFETPGEPSGLVTHRGYTYLADRRAILGFAPIIQTDVNDTELEEEFTEIDLRLFPGSPNPTTSHTSVSFYMPNRGNISLNVYNVLGRHVATIATGVHNVGTHQYQWDGATSEGNSVASGIYFIRLRTETDSRTQKVVMMR